MNTTTFADALFAATVREAAAFSRAARDAVTPDASRAPHAEAAIRCLWLAAAAHRRGDSEMGALWNDCADFHRRYA